MQKPGRRLVGAIVAALVVGSAAAAGPLEDAGEAYNRGDYATAIRTYRPLAEQGNAIARAMLGFMYLNGQGVPQNYTEAAKWCQLAAEDGIRTAQLDLGVMYLNGQGVPQNYAVALKWFGKAANQGNSDDPGSQSFAQFYLGVMHRDAQGVPQNYAEALKWFGKAANGFIPGAQSALSHMYYYGQGVPQNYVYAHMWANLAAANPNSTKAARDEAVHDRDVFARTMTPAQIAEAQKLASEWRPTSR
jgi:TPR repeat protein